MKRFVLVLILVGGLGLVQAQDTFVGGGVTLLTDFTFAAPVVGVQVGGSVADNLYLRGTLDTLLFLAYFVGGDVLYTFPLQEADATVYVGGGPDVLFVLFPTSVGVLSGAAFGVHATAGAEFDAGEVGIYLEGQPGFFFGDGGALFLARVRAGVNFHF
jgi:hypothetical protein